MSTPYLRAIDIEAIALSSPTATPDDLAANVAAAPARKRGRAAAALRALAASCVGGRAEAERDAVASR